MVYCYRSQEGIAVMKQKKDRGSFLSRFRQAVRVYSVKSLSFSIA
jgi:hypothetical protein